MTKKSFRYNFSFIMPVYNAAPYLREALDSIIGQNIGFKDNVQLILVNDGSVDASSEICQGYVSAYPENIVYIEQSNQGVSAARNRGLKEVEGKYVGMMDSDDKLSADTLSEVYCFFEKHRDEVDMVSIKMRFFDNRTGEHPLNFKYNADKVVHIDKDYTYAQLSLASAFIKSEVLLRHTFSSEIRFSEDVKLASEIILEKRAYGVLAKPTYFYRKRKDVNSAIDTTRAHRDWYFVTPVKVFEYVFDLYRDKEGSVARYMQFLVMYDLQWRFKQVAQSVLGNEELKWYKQTLYGLIRDIDDDIIMQQKNLPSTYKVFLLGKKYGKRFDTSLKRNGAAYELNGTRVYDYAARVPNVHIDFIEIEKEELVIEGFVTVPLMKDDLIEVDVGGKTYAAKRTHVTHRVKKFLDEVVYTGGCFITRVPVPAESEVTFWLNVGGKRLRLPVVTKRHSRLASRTGGYRVIKKLILRKSADSIKILPYSTWRHVVCEIRWDARVLVALKLRFAYEQLGVLKRTGFSQASPKEKLRPFLIPIKSVLFNIISVFWRLAFYVAKLFYRQKIWIVSDRVDAAGDNGEALFRYLKGRQDLPVRVYYAISKQSPDYNKMAKVGPVIDRNSARYKLLFLLADKIISSHADDFVINAFGARVEDTLGLFRFDFVFLQHGITKDDISGWLNRYNKNIKLFVAAAKPEYDSLLGVNYGYTKREVKLTGFPRYDALINSPKNKLIIAPTWRRNISVDVNQTTGKREYSPAFKRSEYFQFYQNMMSDKRLVAALKAADMTGEFYLHPSFAVQTKDFKSNETVSVKAMPYSYKQAFSEGSILVTDFSSVAFDFAYLKKPVVYTQFDRKTFFQGHLYDEGYFSYERDGFGDVTYDYESSIKAIINVIESGSKLSKKYEKRIDSFFYKFDKDNSKRVYEAVMEIDKEKM